MFVLETLLQGAVDTLFVLIILAIAKKVRDARFSAALQPAGGDPRELTADYQVEEASNLAVALRICGLSIGFGFGLAGVVSGGVVRFSAGMDLVLQNMGQLLGYCALLLVFLFLAELIADRIILSQVNNTVELKNGNTAVGLAEFGIFVATGLIAYGSFHGEGGGWYTALGFFGMGQAALIAFAAIYEWATPFRMVEQIRQGNAAAGLMLGGTLVTLGVILCFAIAGPFTGWREGIIGFAVSAGVGIALLIPFQILIDKIFLPNTTLKIEVERDRNVAASAVTVCLQVALAIMIGSLVAG
ncbi:MAG: DUF350 domain-containing protein [Acidobacteria bacterium]|nr:DUF350 domain-containing protein [Acidobacteriota bacterium]